MEDIINTVNCLTLYRNLEHYLPKFSYSLFVFLKNANLYDDIILNQRTAFLDIRLPRIKQNIMYRQYKSY